MSAAPESPRPRASSGAQTRNLRGLDPAAHREAVSIAAELLDRGELVVLPTETAYVLAGTARSAGAASRLRAAAREGAAEVRSAVWLAPTVDGDRGVEREIAHDDLGVGPFTLARHRRIVERLSPGPAIFLAEAGEAGLAAALHELGLPEHAADDGERIAFRISAQATAAAVAARAQHPLITVELMHGGAAAQTADEAAAMLAARGLDGITLLDDGPVRMRAGATVILLKAGGGHTVLREGAYEARFIGKQAERTVLFICTGNTCRSPMAEAIAAGLAARSAGGNGGNGGDGVLLRFESAGVGAGSGMGMTHEAAEALRGLGFSPGAHASRPLTRKLLAEADVVFTMTRSHAAAVRELDPSDETTDKVQTLDPAGHDVPDPIGQGPGVYTETARRLVDLISRRLKELQP